MELSSNVKILVLRAIGSTELLGGRYELFHTNASLTKGACEGSDFKFAMKRNYTPASILVTKHHVTPTLTGLMKPQFTQSPNRIPS